MITPGLIGCEADYQALYQLIQSRTGIRLTEHQQEDVVVVVEDMLQSQPATTFANLLLRLTRESVDHPIWQPIIKIVTIGETYFFRNQSQFDALRQSVLPALIEKRRRAGTHYLRLWSAGCSGGEEPYSLAILLRDLIPDIDLWSIYILATDINLDSLTRARTGIYRTWSFRGETPMDLTARWFRITPEGFKLADSIRQMVTFAPLNLVTDGYPAHDSGTLNLDLIVCRNVTIYFDQMTTREVVSRFHRCLNDDGWLVVGHSEPMATIYDEWFAPCNFENTVLYRKVAQPAEKPVVTALPRTQPLKTAALPKLPTPEPLKLTSALPKTAPLSKTVPLPKTAPLSFPEAINLPPFKGETGPLTLSPKAAPQVSVADMLTFAKQAADQERWDEALKWLAQVEDLDRLNPQLHYLRALVQLHQNQRDNALLSLRQAIYCDPNFALAHYTLAEMYQQRGELKDAARHLRLTQKAIASLPPNHRLSFSDDLTVEMLHELLTHRLRNLPEAHYVAL